MKKQLLGTVLLLSSSTLQAAGESQDPRLAKAIELFLRQQSIQNHLFNESRGENQQSPVLINVNVNSNEVNQENQQEMRQEISQITSEPPALSSEKSTTNFFAVGSCILACIGWMYILGRPLLRRNTDTRKT
jgi:hypothetical protein